MTALPIIAAILTALPEEMAGIERDWPEMARLGAWSIRKLDGSSAFATAICGFKANHLSAILHDLPFLESQAPIILLGCCGALSPSLSLYDAVVAEGHVDPVTGHRQPTSPDLSARIQHALTPIKIGWFASSNEILRSSKQKQACAVGCGASVVEMEGLIISQALENTPFLFASVRWVLDGAGEEIHDKATQDDPTHLSAHILFERLAIIADRISACIPLILGGQ